MEKMDAILKELSKKTGKNTSDLTMGDLFVQAIKEKIEEEQPGIAGARCIEFSTPDELLSCWTALLDTVLDLPYLKKEEA